MKNMLKYIFPAEFFTKPAYFRAFVLAFLYLLVIVTQLFTYESFAGVVSGFVLIGGQAMVSTIAFCLPLLEAASLPYLISMKLPERYRNISKWAAIITPIVWFVIAVWQNVSPAVDKTNTGIFGATIPTTVGLWAILFTGLWIWAIYLVKNELPRRK